MTRPLHRAARALLAAVSFVAVVTVPALATLPAAWAVHVVLGLAGLDVGLDWAWLAVTTLAWVAVGLLYGGGRDDDGGDGRPRAPRAPRGPVRGTAAAAASSSLTLDDVGAREVAARARTTERSMENLMARAADCAPGRTVLVAGLVDGTPTVVVVCRDHDAIEERAVAAYRGAHTVSPSLPALPN